MSLSKASDDEECVKVVVRCRPFNGTETNDSTKMKCIVFVEHDLCKVTVHKPENAHGKDIKEFTFDHVYGPQALQRTIFDEVVRPIVDSVLDGYNGTVFAYGQTGTGKTFTMEGDIDDAAMRGIMPNSFYHIFEQVDKVAENIEFLVRMSFLEIYNDEVYDLLNMSRGRHKMSLRENQNGFFVKDLSSYVVKSVSDLMKLLRMGQKARRTGETKMNAGSSRSHSVLSIIVEASETIREESGSASADAAGFDSAGGNDAKDDTKDDAKDDAKDDVTKRYRAGKLNLVDLAGSERQKKTQANDSRLLEAKSINLSLAALGNVIKALVDAKQTHVPFRDSKLTRLLRDSLGGNTKTVMMANVGPSVFNYDETMSTLRYANRAKNIKNKPTINEDPKDALLRKFQEELEELKRKLAVKRGLAGGSGMTLEQQQKMLIEHQKRLKSQGDSHSLSRSDSMEQIIEERIVEKLVIKDTGISEADVEDLQRKAAAAKEALLHASEEVRSRLEQEKRAAEEEAAEAQKELMTKIAIEEEERLQLEEMERAIREKEQSLLKGGMAMDDAMKAKAELERTEAELEHKRREEQEYLQKLAEAEDAELFMEGRYKNLGEELTKKTKKLKKLWQKRQAIKAEIDDLEDEWQDEREELVDTIRGLDRELKLKQMILESFCPPLYIEHIEKVAHWDQFQDTWIIPGLDFAGNNVERPVSRGGARASSVGAVHSYGASFEPSQNAIGISAPLERHAERNSVYLTYGKSRPKRKGGRRNK